MLQARTWTTPKRKPDLWNIYQGFIKNPSGKKAFLKDQPE